MQIELRHVYKQFGRVSALRDVCVTIPTGHKVALIGPNGSGKSTLTRAIMGIIACDGEVLIDGRPAAAARTDLARLMGYVPQIAPHFGASVDDLIRTIAQVRDIDRGEIERLAGGLELELAPIRRQPFRNLSGGMKQKLLIALALASRPQLLIMDEPTASLDARARDRFFQLLDQVAEGATLLLCSHRWDELRHLVDHVIAMEDGRVIHDGPADRFLDGRVMSVIEVHLEPSDQGAWLQSRGFHSGREGWWVRTVSQLEKMELVPEMTATLGPRLQNLLVRDLETIDVSDQMGGHHVTSLE